MNQPPITVLVHAHNAAAYLERSLPLVLGQDYPCFEVLVVVDKCTDHTVDCIEQMELRWPSLRHITIPSSAWHPNRYRLAIMLGAKTAKYEWIMLLQPEFAPHSTLWLQHMAGAVDNHVERIIGYTGIEPNSSDKERFVSTFEQWLSLPRHQGSTEDSNTLIRRDLLQQGAVPNTPHSTAVMHPDATVRRTLPYGDVWWREQLQHHRKHLATMNWRYKCLHALTVWALVLAGCVSTLLGWLSWWWIGLALFTIWATIISLLFSSFCKKVDEKPFYFTFLQQYLLLPLHLYR